jgi:general secretion pathway protein I
MISPSRQGGFTLIEVVVAFAIFALCVGALYEVFQSSLQRTLQGEQRAEALSHAESLLSELRVRPPPWPEHASGQFDDGYAWDVAVKAHVEPKASSPSAPPAFDPWLDVDVTVSVHHDAHLLATLRSVELQPVSP